MMRAAKRKESNIRKYILALVRLITVLLSLSQPVQSHACSYFESMSFKRLGIAVAMSIPPTLQTIAYIENGDYVSAGLMMAPAIYSVSRPIYRKYVAPAMAAVSQTYDQYMGGRNKQLDSEVGNAFSEACLDTALPMESEFNDASVDSSVEPQEQSTYAFLFHYRKILWGQHRGPSHSAVLFGQAPSGQDRQVVLNEFVVSLLNNNLRYPDTGQIRGSRTYHSGSIGYVSFYNTASKTGIRLVDRYALNDDLRRELVGDVIALPETTLGSVTLNFSPYRRLSNNCAHVARDVISQLYTDFRREGGTFPENIKGRLRQTYGEELIDIKRKEVLNPQAFGC